MKGLDRSPTWLTGSLQSIEQTMTSVSIIYRPGPKFEYI